MKKRYPLIAAALVLVTAGVVTASTNGPSSHASCCADEVALPASVVTPLPAEPPPSSTTTELAPPVVLDRAPLIRLMNAPAKVAKAAVPVTSTSVAPVAAEAPPEPTTTTTTVPAPVIPQERKPAGDPKSFTLLYRNGARWSSCEPIRYVVDTTHARDAAAELATVKTAFDRIAEVTGLKFEYAGPAAEGDNYSRFRAPYQPKAYGERWAPILVQFTNSVSGEVRGQANSNTAKNADGKTAIVSGQIGLNPLMGRNLNVVMHEIGHVIGLGHVDDFSQVMGEHSRTQEFGAGDLAGFKRQGASDECLEIPKPRN